MKKSLLETIKLPKVFYELLKPINKMENQILTEKELNSKNTPTVYIQGNLVLGYKNPKTYRGGKYFIEGANSENTYKILDIKDIDYIINHFLHLKELLENGK